MRIRSAILCLAFLLALAPLTVHAQTLGWRLKAVSGVPTGSCLSSVVAVDVRIRVDVSPYTVYMCMNGSYTLWSAGGGGGGAGDVIGPGVSAVGELPIFTNLGGNGLGRTNTLTGFVFLTGGLVSVVPALGNGSKVQTTAITTPAGRKCVEVDSAGALQIASSDAPCGSGSGGGGGLADPGGNGIIKRISLNTTAPAVASTDYLSPSVVASVTAAFTFAPAKLVVGTAVSAPTCLANSFYRNSTDHKLYVCNDTGTAWAEVFLPDVSGAIPVLNGGTGATLLNGILKGNGTGAVTSAKADEIEAPLFGADSGSNDTYTTSLSPAITAYVLGTHYRFKANTANTGIATINFNSLGAKTIKKAVGGITTDLADNDIRAGQWVDVVYDGTNMQMQSLLGNAAVGGGGTPGGSDTQIQYNNASAFAGTSGATATSTQVTLVKPLFASVAGLPTACTVGEEVVDSTQSNRKYRCYVTGNPGTWGAVFTAGLDQVNMASNITGVTPIANGGTANSSIAYVTLTDGATITWTVAGIVNNATVTLGGNRTLAFSGLANGMSGTLIVKQDATGSRSLALPAGAKVIGGGAGVVTLTSAANAVDILAWTYDGSVLYVNLGKNYN